MERKLASIQIISNIKPIEGADFIEVISVLGWECVAKKGEYQIGQKCIYLEVDSIVPQTEYFEFMRDRHFRVKTIKLRKQISQGLVIPLSLLPLGKYNIEDDVTSELGITKYDPETSSGGTKTGIRGGLAPWPSCIPKTDEMRIQSIPKILDEIKGKAYYITQKQDGCSSTFLYDHSGKFHACSRNGSVPEFKRKRRTWKQRLFSWHPFKKYDQVEDHGNIYWEIADKYDLKNKLSEMKNIAIQGEICGPAIQKNRICLPELEIFVFNVYDVECGCYLDYSEAKEVAANLGLLFVPLIEVGNCFNFTQEGLLEMAKGEYQGTKNHREGIVIRTLTESYSNVLRGRMSFKAINNDYLLKEE